MEMDPAKLFQVLDTIDSTNNYAMGQIHAGLAHHGSAWMAREQFSGKGQRGKTWESEPGRNIALSICLNPGAAYHPNPFLFSARLAIICRDFVQTLVPDKVKIKWPNDIYIGDRKAGGLLVENIYQGQSWKW
ncbi:MAG TPA: biotin--[acetyl-CoA-carboxylase] ligase, partial [Ferruginibacter sp.]|nr:biotin--[acetyl-CoA-carboxylase] ligase [Ferruginibacter sp.]